MKFNKKITNRIFHSCVSVILAVSLIVPAQAQSVLDLPQPGTMISLTSDFNPTTIIGMTLHPEDPLLFDFIVHPGDSDLQGEAFQNESRKLIKYFLSALTVPEEEMWVNLSPYEKDRIIPPGFGNTEMGRDLLAQDYLLKQLIASLMYPEEELGNEFWNRIYDEAGRKYGISELPVNTFNKVWIIPESATIHVNGKSVFVVDSHLKVMLEEDYLALETNQGSRNHGLGNVEKDDLNQVDDVSLEVIREVIIPAIEKEVNQGTTFANLRQISNSVILAAWYKEKVQGSILEQIYINKNKTFGIDTTDKEINQKIYKQYVEAFQKGVYNFIKEDYDATTQKIIPRKYFSGGAVEKWSGTFRSTDGSERLKGRLESGAQFVRTRLGKFQQRDPMDAAMAVDPLGLMRSWAENNHQEAIIARQNDPPALIELIEIALGEDPVLAAQAINAFENLVDEYPNQGWVIKVGAQIIGQIALTRFERISRASVLALEKMLRIRNLPYSQEISFHAALALANIIRLDSSGAGLINAETVNVLEQLITNSPRVEILDNGASGVAVLALMEIKENQPQLLGPETIQILREALPQIKSQRKDSGEESGVLFTRHNMTKAINALDSESQTGLDTGIDDAFLAVPQMTHLIYVDDIGKGRLGKFQPKSGKGSMGVEADRIEKFAAELGAKIARQTNFLKADDPYLQEVNFDGSTVNHFVVMGAFCNSCIAEQTREIVKNVSRGANGTTTHITFPLSAIQMSYEDLKDSLKYFIPNSFLLDNRMNLLRSFVYPEDPTGELIWRVPMYNDVQIVVMKDERVIGRFVDVHHEVSSEKFRTVILHFQASRAATDQMLNTAVLSKMRAQEIVAAYERNPLSLEFESLLSDSGLNPASVRERLNNAVQSYLKGKLKELKARGEELTKINTGMASGSIEVLTHSEIAGALVKVSLYPHYYDGYQVAKANLVISRLAGRFAQTIIIEEPVEWIQDGKERSYPVAVISEELDLLSNRLEQLNLNIDSEHAEARRLVEDYRSMLIEMWQVGVHDYDFNGIVFNNAGVDKKTGKVKMFDLDKLSGNRNDFYEQRFGVGPRGIYKLGIDKLNQAIIYQLDAITDGLSEFFVPFRQDEFDEHWNKYPEKAVPMSPIVNDTTREVVLTEIEMMLREADAAIVSKSDVGGIDLNSNNIKIKTEGVGAIIEFPLNSQNIPAGPVDGFVPQIITISPVTDIPLLLGD